MLKKLWSDEQGTVAFEYLLVGTLVALSLVVGLNAVGRALNSELIELAGAIVNLDQSYSYTNVSTCSAFVNSSFATDPTGNPTSGNTTATGGSVGVDFCSGAQTP